MTQALEKILAQFNLQPHPEGGYFSQTYRSDDQIKSCSQSRYNGEERSAGTAIYYLLNQNDFSAWHILKSDELWHYYTGGLIAIHIIDANGKLTTHLLGDAIQNPNSSFQISIKAGNWFAAENVDKSTYTLVGCTVNPGFEFTDFKLGDRDFLIAQFPQHEEIITNLTHERPEENYRIRLR